MKKQLNIFGKDLIPCSLDPITGFLEMVVVKQVYKIKVYITYVWLLIQNFLIFLKAKEMTLLLQGKNFLFQV